MNTQAELRLAFEEYQAGTFIHHPKNREIPKIFRFEGQPVGAGLRPAPRAGRPAGSRAPLRLLNVLILFPRLQTSGLIQNGR